MKPWDRFRGKRRCPTCGVPSLICKECVDRDESGDKKIGKDVKCKLCVEEGVESKADWKRREEELMNGYEEKLKVKEKEKKRTEKDSRNGENTDTPSTSNDVANSEEANDITANVTTPDSNPNNETRLWIGNLNNKKVTPDNLIQIIPNIKFVQWLYGPDGKGCKGFCFVEMKSEEDAGRAKAGEGVKVFGRPVKINYQEKDGKSSWPPPNAIYY